MTGVQLSTSTFLHANPVNVMIKVVRTTYAIPKVVIVTVEKKNLMVKNVTDVRMISLVSLSANLVGVI